MPKFLQGEGVWLAVIVCVLLSTLTDTLSTIAWERRSIAYFLSMTVLAPLAFLVFGYVGSQFGLSVASSLTNSFIAIGPVIVGLVFREEWRRMPWQVYIGMALIIAGITLVALFRPAK